jgi:hypothetical protein
MEGIASIARASERPSPAARVIAEGSPVWWPRLRPLRSISQQASSSGATIAAAIKIPMAGACAQCRRQSTSRPRTHTISSAGQPTAGSWKTGYRQIAPRIGSAIDHDRGSRRSGLARSPAPVTERVSACAAQATARLAASGESGRRISSCPQAAAGVRCCGFLERAGDSFQVVCPKRAGDSLRASSVFFDRQDQANMDFTHYQA